MSVVKQKFQQGAFSQQNLKAPLLAYLALLAPKAQPTKQEIKLFLNPAVLKYFRENFSLKKIQPHEKGLVVPMYNK